MILTGAELSRLPRDRTIRPRISTPSVVMLPAALMGFSPATEQSKTTFTEVLLTVTWSFEEERGEGKLETQNENVTPVIPIVWAVLQVDCKIISKNSMIFVGMLLYKDKNIQNYI